MHEAERPWPVGAELHWFRLPDGACFLSAEGDATVLPEAELFAAALGEAGLPALAGLEIPAFVRALVASEFALLGPRMLRDRIWSKSVGQATAAERPEQSSSGHSNDHR